MKKTARKMPRGEMKEVTLNGLNVVRSTDSSVTINIPIVRVPRHHGPMFDDGFMEYCRDHHVSEELLDEMHNFFYSRLYAKEVSRFLMEHIEEFDSIEDLDSIME